MKKLVVVLLILAVTMGISASICLAYGTNATEVKEPMPTPYGWKVQSWTTEGFGNQTIAHTQVMDTTGKILMSIEKPCNY